MQTAGSIAGRKFRVRAGGYKKGAVESFLARVAEDYQRVVDAAVLRVEGDDRFEGLAGFFADVEEMTRCECGDAEAEARSLRRNAIEEASRIRARAVREASSIREEAIEAAHDLLAQAELLHRTALATDQRLRARSRRDVEKTRMDAVKDVNRVILAARDHAAALLSDSERRAQALIERTQREADTLLRESTTRLAALKNHEREVIARIAELEAALDRLAHIIGGVALQAAALDHNPLERGGPWFAFLEPREVQLVRIAGLMRAPAQQTVDVFAALIRDVASMLHQVTASNDMLSRLQRDPADRS